MFVLQYLKWFTSFYRVSINMEKEIVAKALFKYANSDIIKRVYPMLDRIEIVHINDNIHFVGYDIDINIYLNDPDIDKNNMYTKKFDPHWLVSHHLKKLSKYLGVDIHNIGFKLYNANGELILNWS